MPPLPSLVFVPGFLAKWCEEHCHVSLSYKLREAMVLGRVTAAENLLAIERVSAAARESKLLSRVADAETSLAKISSRLHEEAKKTAGFRFRKFRDSAEERKQADREEASRALGSPEQTLARDAQALRVRRTHHLYELLSRTSSFLSAFCGMVIAGKYFHDAEYMSAAAISAFFGNFLPPYLGELLFLALLVLHQSYSPIGD